MPYIWNNVGTLPTITSNEDWTAVARNGSVFCAITSNNNDGIGASTSATGVTWSAKTTVSASGAGRDITSNGTIFVVVAWSLNVCFTSTDGAAWTQRTMPSTQAWSCVAWNGTVFAAIGYSAGVAATSSDGITWIARTTPSGYPMHRVAAGNGVFVAVSHNSATAITSPDGITWTMRTLPSACAFNPQITWNGAVFCVLKTATPGRVFTSPDGVAWTDRVLPGAVAAGTVGVFGTTLLVVSNNGVAYSSEDNGVTWVSETVSTGDWTAASKDITRALVIAASPDADSPVAVRTLIPSPPPPPPNNSSTIVFEPLVSSPQTSGSSVVSFPRLGVRGVETGGLAGVSLTALRVVGLAQQNTLGTGTGLLSFPALQVYGSEAIAPYAGINAWGIVRLPRLTTTGIDNKAPVPQDGSSVVSLPELEIVATAFESMTGTGVVTLPAAFVYGSEVGGDYGLVELPAFTANGVQVVVLPTGSIYGAVQPIASVLGSYTWVFYDEVVLTDTLLTEVLLALQSHIDLSDTFSPLATFVMALESNLTAHDAFRFFFEISVNDTVTLTDETTISPEALLALADQLMLTDETLSLGDALIALASAFTAADTIKSSIGASLVSEFTLADAIISNLALVAELVSEALLLDETNSVLMMSTLLSDSIVFDDDINTLFAALMELADGIDFAIRIRTPEGDVYAGYMMNVRTAAVAEVTNFKFNSFATIGGKTFAAGPGGIYELGGDTDEGAEIAARVRLGLEDFGTSQLKRVPNAYIGYTSTGRLLLKVITTDGGAKKENWYALKPRTAISPVENRFDIAKGLVARYWGWELTNIDGADFELDSLKVWPMVLQRRKSGR